MTYFALYEAYGTHKTQWGSDPDRQKANTKEEESDLNLLNEGMRFRDLETGVFLTRDPIGYGDGPNVYCYVHCNPIMKFDPLGLSWWSNTWKGDFDGADTTWAGVGGQVGVGLIPVVGQIADARDTAANIKNVWNNPKSKGAWAGLGGAVVGWVPLIGDAAKGAFKVGKKVAVEGSQKLITEGSQQVVKQLDGIPLKNNSARKLLKSRGATKAQAKEVVDSFDGQITATQGLAGDSFVVTETATGDASGLFVTRGSAGSTPSERISNLALPESNMALVETPVSLSRNQVLLEGNVASQVGNAGFSDKAVGGATQVVTDAFNDGVKR